MHFDIYYQMHNSMMQKFWVLHNFLTPATDNFTCDLFGWYFGQFATAPVLLCLGANTSSGILNIQDNYFIPRKQNGQNTLGQTSADCFCQVFPTRLVVLSV
jgi:hypothetical protein